MSIHIGAEKGEVAERVLLPGDPLRARYIAEKFLTEVHQYNTVRNMLGFTGTAPDGRRVSVQGSGMGMPSLGIYANELFRDYCVQEIIRVGTCGAFQKYIHLKDIVIAMTACSNSNINRRRFNGMDYCPTANWDLLYKAYEIAKSMHIPGWIGSILASDTFYDPDPEEWKMWASFNVLAVEMETAELYTLAAQYNRRALTILTVSDCLASDTPGEQMSSEERERSLDKMISIALRI